MPLVREMRFGCTGYGVIGPRLMLPVGMQTSCSGGAWVWRDPGVVDQTRCQRSSIW